MLTILRLTAKGPAKIEDFLDDIRRFVDTVHPKDPISLLPEEADTDDVMRRRLNAAIEHLREAGLLTGDGSGGKLEMTERGRRLLQQNPKGIDDSVLEQFVEFRRYIAKQGETGSVMEPTPVYRTGFAQFRDGVNLADNPYDPETSRFLEWNAGWFEAFEEDLDHRRDSRPDEPKR